MSGPPGSGILNRQPYNGEPAWPNIGGAPKRGLETTSLPGGSLSAESITNIELTANATATFPIFVSPFASDNEFLENDIVCVRYDDGQNSISSAMNGLYARPLRLLRTDLESRGTDGYFFSKEDAKAEINRWRILGICISVGHKGPNDRQVINVAVRGRLGVPCIFVPQSINQQGNPRNLYRGDEMFVVLSASKVVGKGVSDEDQAAAAAASGMDGNPSAYKIDVGLCSLRTVSDIPANNVPGNLLGNRNNVAIDADGNKPLDRNETEFRTWLTLGTYIRPLSAVTSSRSAVERYLDGGNTILDRRATFEVALRL